MIGRWGTHQRGLRCFKLKENYTTRIIYKQKYSCYINDSENKNISKRMEKSTERKKT